MQAADRPVLVVDNFDSFVYNLVQYLGQLGVRCIVRRNDEVTVDELDGLDVAGVLLSPGPGTPADAGVTVHGHPLPLARRRPGHRARRARGHRTHGGRRDHGPWAPLAADRGGPV